MKQGSKNNESIIDELKKQNIVRYNGISKAYNKLYLGQPTGITIEDIQAFDEQTFDGKLINESCVLQVIEHGEYNDIDALKFFKSKSLIYL